MKISVIVPVYNSELLLSRCIESICNQTYKDIEILIVDDGSSDNSGMIADEYAAKDNRVKVLHQKNKGVSSARNAGIEASTGDCIAFVDSDDYIRPTMYQRLLEIIRAYNVDIVTTDFDIDGKYIVNNLDPRRIYVRDEIYRKVLPSFTYQGTIGIMEFKNKLFRTELIKRNKISFYEGFSYQEDLMFMINIYAHAESLYYLPESFYEYYPTSEGLYSSYRENGGEKFIAARSIMISLIDKYAIPNIDWHTFNNAFLYNISFYVYRTLNYVKDKKKQEYLINSVLMNEVVITCCKSLVKSAHSFDRRIAKSIIDGAKIKAIYYIKFVYSGKAEKAQKLISVLKNRV